jgi:hypothetical protein
MIVQPRSATVQVDPVYLNKPPVYLIKPSVYLNKPSVYLIKPPVYLNKPPVYDGKHLSKFRPWWMKVKSYIETHPGSKPTPAASQSICRRSTGRGPCCRTKDRFGTSNASIRPKRCELLAPGDPIL